MSLRVLIVPERPLNDQYVLKPVVERLFQDLQRRARVEILPDVPEWRGADRILEPAVIQQIVTENAMVRLFLLMVDRDCNRQGNVEKARARAVEQGDKLIECLAIEELEVWMLALHRSELSASWQAVRAECDPKERFAEPFLQSKGWGGPGGGRKRAMRDLGQGWTGGLTVCPELGELKQRVAAWLTAQGLA